MLCLITLSGCNGGQQPLASIDTQTPDPAPMQEQIPASFEIQPEKPDSTAVSFKINNQEISLKELSGISFIPDSGNYGKEGEMTIIFKGADRTDSTREYTLGLTFPGKTTGKFMAKKGRVPFLDPLMQYVVTDPKNATSTSYSSTTMVTGDDLEIEITKLDAEKVEGKFSGVLSEIHPTGYKLKNKVTVSDGIFTVDLSKHEITDQQLE